jgi:drug/metabolite transporter (DMT)-like permease
VNLALPVLAAVGGAFVFGVTGVLQQRAARRVEGETTDQAGLIQGLVAQRSWVASTIGSIVGFGLQALALGTGPIVLVQPLLVTGVLFAAGAAFLLNRRPPDWPFIGSLALTAAGLGVFLAIARPNAGGDTFSIGAVLPLGISLVVLVVAAVTLALRVHGLARSLAFALATGVVYGVTAAVAKVTVGAFSAGAVAGLTSWSLWSLVVLGPSGFLLNQNAFREGELVSPALAVITVTDPLVGIGIGVLWLNESIAGSAPAVVGEVLGLAAMAGGVWLVAHRAPHLTGAGDEGSSRRDGSSRPGVEPGAAQA